jgi:hypothetical protein
MKLVLSFCFFLVSSLAALAAPPPKPITIKDAIASLGAAYASNGLILKNGYKCSKYIWPPANLPPQDASPIKAEKLSGFSCVLMDSETSKKLCNKSLNESTYEPLKTKLAAIANALKTKACKDLPVTVQQAAATMEQDIKSMQKADDSGGYLKKSFTWEKQYTLCSKPRNPKDEFSNIESGYYKSLRSNLSLSLNNLKKLSAQSGDQLCAGR